MIDSTLPQLPAARVRTAVVAAGLAAVLAAMLAVEGCRSAPFTGRDQLVLIPEAQEIQLGVLAYQEALAAEQLSQDAAVAEIVERVGRRIAAVADKPEYDWEFRVIAGDARNAFALPGGKVAVYEGILPVCQSEAGLAVVMSHEIAHALARHGGERMSQQAAVTGIGGVINAVSQRKADEVTTGKIMQVYGLTSEYGVILPFSRKHELEADAIGLILMAKAGYDPSVAPEFWERFSLADGQQPPEWLSTHPSDARRAADLRSLLPEAMKYYATAAQQIGMGEPLPRSAGMGNAAPRQNRADTQLPSVQQSGSASVPTAGPTGQPDPVTHALHTEIVKPTGGREVQAAAGGSSEDASHRSDELKSAHFELPVRTNRPVPAPQVEQNDFQGWEAAQDFEPSE